MAPTLEEEPLDLDEVAVGEWVEAGSEEDRLGVEAAVLIVVPGPASGVSEKERGKRKTTMLGRKKGVPTADGTRFEWIPGA
jgi:hypothetical protein